MKTQQLSVTEYAKIRGVTTQAIRLAIKEERQLPGVTKVEKFGKTWVLTYQEKKLP